MHLTGSVAPRLLPGIAPCQPHSSNSLQMVWPGSYAQRCRERSLGSGSHLLCDLRQVLPLPGSQSLSVRSYLWDPSSSARARCCLTYPLPALPARRHLEGSLGARNPHAQLFSVQDLEFKDPMPSHQALPKGVERRAHIFRLLLEGEA